MITWIVGSGGLLGQALARQATHTYRPGSVPWSDPHEAGTTLHAQARAFESATARGPWRVIWAAGAATTSTPPDAAMSELIPLEGLLTGLRSAMPTGPGSVFITSSAGGVYAGAQNPPFSDITPPAPLSPYGELKLAQERLAQELLGSITTVIIGRVSNLYGPGQNLDKLQGLISRLALTAITQQPLDVFVPLGTIRDYLHVDDAARLILDLTAAPQQPQESPDPLILATGQGTTIGQLIRTTKDVTKRKVPVALGSHPSASAQAADLRLMPSIEPPRTTPLPAGIKDVYLDLLDRLQDGNLA